MPDRPFPMLGFQLDVARQLERLETLCAAIDGQADNGYNLCLLYLEDAYAYPSHPTIGRPHAYSPDDLRRVQCLCAKQGMELVPVIPALGHAAYITGKPGYAHLDEFPDQPRGSLNPCLEDTYDLLESLIADWCEHLPGSYVHVSLDESASMGQWAEQQGREVDHAAMFAGHCNRLNAIIRRHGRRMLMWGDMFYYYPAAITRLDQDIIVLDWYYYAFEQTPRVEVYNFAPADSGRRLTDAGLETWGVPSLWPNLPLPNLVERWQNTTDWTRYGKECGFNGLILSDWENSTGFCATSAWLIRAFGRCLTRGRSLRESLIETLAEAGNPQPTLVVDDLLLAGQHHLTAHGDRTILFQPLSSLAAPAGQPLCQAHVEALQAGDWSWCDTAEDDLSQALALSVRLILLAWRLGSQVPDIYQRLHRLADGLEDDRLSRDLQDLRDAISSFGADYSAYWQRVRFDDDVCPVADWATRTRQELDAWHGALTQGRVDDHPLRVQPLLQVEVTCHHPALPVVELQATWQDGSRQSYRRALIRFASSFAVPDCTWEEYLALGLAQTELPESLRISAPHYGQFTVRDVAIYWRGERWAYTLDSLQGDHSQLIAGQPILGPVGATPEDPTHRAERDTAIYRRII